MQINASSSQNWLFHVAAEANAGGGHVSRSLVLAREMQGQVQFSIAENSPYASLISDAGFSVITPEQENPSYDGIWVDSYGADFNKYRQKTNRLAIIEDHKDLYDKADIYIRPYPGSFSAHPYATILTGFEYAFIDQKYFNVANHHRTETVKTLSIFMGRYDSVNAAENILRVLQTLPDYFMTQIIIGSKSAHRSSVENYLDTNYQRPHKLIMDCPDLCSVYQESDLMILSGGVAVLECCAAQVPAIVLNIADNQKPLSAFLSEQKMIAYAGSFTDFNADQFKNYLIGFLQGQARHDIVSRLPGPLTPYGAQNVAMALNSIIIKEAEHA